MKQYELVVITSGKLNEKETHEVTDSLKKLFDKYSAKITEENDWGVLKFSYPINKEERGHYFMWHLSMESEQAPVLQKDLRVADKVLRFLFIDKPKHDKKYGAPVLVYKKRTEKESDKKPLTKPTDKKELKIVKDADKPAKAETKATKEDTDKGSLDKKLDEILEENI